MSDQDELHKSLLKTTARAMALEKLLLAVVAASPDKVQILKAFEHEMESHSTRTLFDSEMKDYPENELPAAYDSLFGQVMALCQ